MKLVRATVSFPVYVECNMPDDASEEECNQILTKEAKYWISDSGYVGKPIIKISASDYLGKMQRHVIQVIGVTYEGIESTYCYFPGAFQLEPKLEGDVNRELVSGWLKNHAGDFQSITDFQVIHWRDGIILKWNHSDSESKYNEFYENE